MVETCATIYIHNAVAPFLQNWLNKHEQNHANKEHVGFGAPIKQPLSDQTHLYSFYCDVKMDESLENITKLYCRRLLSTEAKQASKLKAFQFTSSQQS